MLEKRDIDISFAQGLDTKTDPKRVPMGKFLKFENAVFDKGGLLQKRNGFGALASLPNTTYSYLTTFSGNLTAIGPTVAALNAASGSWVTKGTITPLSLSTLPLLRNNLNQVAADACVAPNGLVCTAYLENNAGTITNKYVIADSKTGQNIVAPRVIPVASGAVSGGMRVFYLGANFVIVFTNTITATAHLQYITISAANPTLVSANADIASAYIPATTVAWDGVVVGSNLYVAYNNTTGGQNIAVTYLSTAGTVATPVNFATYKATIVSLCSDTTGTTPTIYVNFYRLDTTVGYSLAVDTSLNQVMAPQSIIGSGTILNLASAAQGGICTVFSEVSNTYGFDSSIATNYVQASTAQALTATVTSLGIIMRSVGLASKAFIVSGDIYVLTVFSSPYQPTYFLMSVASRAAAPLVAAKLAYQNGGGYLTKGLPSVTLIGTTAYTAYLYKDLIQAANKGTALSAGTQTNGIYSQTGLNLAAFDFTAAGLDTAEIGSGLHIGGGFLWLYDGYLPVEHNFFLYPDTDATNPTDMASWSTTGGSIVAKPDAATNTNAYWYQFTYEWTDNQGNAHRSAPSIPIPVTTSGTGTSGSITLNIPTLRVTMKTANPVKIVIYRWSVGQQNYYQTTSITSPVLNDTTADYVTFVDTNADATILGNNLIYTTGGVVEDVNAPASNLLALFDSRLWLVDAEDPNLLWYSKQVIEATPVEMSDLLTVYVPPNVGTNVNLGPTSTLATMDDKLIIGKRDGFAYINGTGPDNTGANGQYSQAIFITSTVGCANQRSIILTPNGLMFQSNKGIWILGRDLSTNYIGAPVQDYTTGAAVTSAVLVPGTNQVRFTLNTGVTLMYDYYYDQWGTFNVSASSSCIYAETHTFINSAGAAYQETPGSYLDGSEPVVMAFQTGPLRLGNLQNYQRAFFFYLLGTYISPHTLLLSISYDYEPQATQTVLINPNNYSTPFGGGTSQSPFGAQNPYGGPGAGENWRVFLERQRCMAVSVGLQEIYDPTQGAAAGAGLTLSGLSMICAFKKPFRPQAAATSAG